MSIDVAADNQLDTLAAFDNLTASLAVSGRWIAGLTDVQAAAAKIRPVLDAGTAQLDYESGTVVFENSVVDEWGKPATKKTEVAGAFFASYAEGKSFRLCVSPGT